MGRAKLAMEYIKKDKARSTTFFKRKKGLIKKANELATLCDVPLCVVIYPSGQNSGEQPETYPLDQAEVRSIAYRYLSIPKDEIAKRSLNLEEALAGKKSSKVDDHHQDSYSANAVNCPKPNCFPQLDLHGFSREQLVNMVSDLDSRLIAVQERINSVIGIYNANASANSVISTNDLMDHQMQWLMCGGATGGFDPMTGGYSNGPLDGYDDFKFNNTVPNFHYGPVDSSLQNSGFGGDFYCYE